MEIKCTKYTEWGLNNVREKKEWTNYEKCKLMNNNIRDQRGGERSEELRGGTEEKRGASCVASPFSQHLLKSPKWLHECINTTQHILMKYLPVGWLSRSCARVPSTVYPASTTPFLSSSHHLSNRCLLTPV